MKKSIKISLISFFALGFIAIILMLSFDIHTKDLKAGKYYLDGDVNSSSYIEITKDKKIKLTGFDFDSKYDEEQLKFRYSQIGDYENLEDYFSNYLEYMLLKRAGKLFVPFSPDGTIERANILLTMDVSFKDRLFKFGEGLYKFVDQESGK